MSAPEPTPSSPAPTPSTVPRLPAAARRRRRRRRTVAIMVPVVAALTVATAFGAQALQGDVGRRPVRDHDGADRGHQPDPVGVRDVVHGHVGDRVLPRCRHRLVGDGGRRGQGRGGRCARPDGSHRARGRGHGSRGHPRGREAVAGAGRRGRGRGRRRDFGVGCGFGWLGIRLLWVYCWTRLRQWLARERRRAAARTPPRHRRRAPSGAVGAQPSSHTEHRSDGLAIGPCDADRLFVSDPGAHQHVGPDRSRRRPISGRSDQGPAEPDHRARGGDLRRRSRGRGVYGRAGGVSESELLTDPVASRPVDDFGALGIRHG